MATKNTKDKRYKLCKNDKGELKEKDILKKTRSEAEKRGMGLGEYIREKGIADEGVCWFTGRSCVEGVEGCDLKLNLEGIDAGMVALVNRFSEIPEVAYFFLSLFAIMIKRTVSSMSDDTLRSLMLGEEGRLSNLVVAEVSRRKGEVESWDFFASAIPHPRVLLTMKPKRDFGEVITTYDYMVGVEAQ